MIPSYFEFYNPVKIISGDLALENIPYELKQMQVERPLIVSDPGVAQAGLLDIVVQAFGGSEVNIGAIYEDTPPDSSMATVKAAVELYRKNYCDSIVAVGGGSVMDTAKSVNVVVTEGGEDLLEYSGAEQLSRPLQPLIAVPTTAGTGSEVTLVAIIAYPEKNIKVAMTSNHLLPRVAVLDPRMTLTMPARITAATGMDALTHAIEGFSCIQKNPLSDAYAVASIELIRDYLVKAVTDGKNKEARMAMANASLMAGISFSNSMVGMVHSLAHAAGGICHVPHGVANAIILPHAMDFNMDKISDIYGSLLLPLAGEEIYTQTPVKKRGPKAADIVRELNQKLNSLCGLPITLKEAGVPRDKLEDIAETALNDGSLTFNPKDMDKKEAIKVLNKAYE